MVIDRDIKRVSKTIHKRLIYLLFVLSYFSGVNPSLGLSISEFTSKYFNPYFQIFVYVSFSLILDFVPNIQK